MKTGIKGRDFQEYLDLARISCKWISQIKHDYKNKFLGRYDNEEAARVYDNALRNILIKEEFKVYNF